MANPYPYPRGVGVRTPGGYCTPCKTLSTCPSVNTATIRRDEDLSAVGAIPHYVPCFPPAPLSLRRVHCLLPATPALSDARSGDILSDLAATTPEHSGLSQEYPEANSVLAGFTGSSKRLIPVPQTALAFTRRRLRYVRTRTALSIYIFLVLILTCRQPFRVHCRYIL